MAAGGRGFNAFHGYDYGPPPPGFAPSQPPGVPQYPNFFTPPAFPYPPTFGPPARIYGGYPQFGFNHPAMAHQTRAPTTDSGFPGIHFRNPSGGVGLPPGYDYLFPAEHCTIHAFQTGAQAPWQTSVAMGQSLPHLKLFVPVNTTVKEMMQRLGCTNDDPKKNILHEVTEKGNGQWAKGITITGDDKDKVKQKISEFGWDASRTGFPGQRPVVWLYLTKD